MTCRRSLIGGLGLGLIAGGAGAKEAGHAGAGAAHPAPGVGPDVAMARLAKGNARFVSGASIHPDNSVPRRILLARGQTPFATILACSDSRVAPELIFDQGLGDLFVCRVAGNVVDDVVLASLEYSVIHLGSQLILVLGHERCGAVQATVEALDGRPSPEDAQTKIGALAERIGPAVKAVKTGARDRLDAAISVNARQAAAEILARSPPLRARVEAGRLKIAAARYDLDDGRVALIEA